MPRGKGASTGGGARRRTGTGARRGALGPCAALLLAFVACAAPAASRDTVVYASGADLESANPLVTVHPMARQVQRFALFVTLARLDSTLEPRPYFARRWDWSEDRTTLTLSLYQDLRWHDAMPTTARDVVFTLQAARDPATGFPRASELAGMEEIVAADDSTVRIRFRDPPPSFPLILCDLPIVPEHVLAAVPRTSYRQHAFATSPTGNGPFRFVSREPGRRWVFERVPDFPVMLGGPATIRRLVIAVVEEPTTKFAGLVSGDLDVAGIAPTMAALASRDPALRVVSYPVTFATAVIFNAARPPFDDARVRRAVDALINRQRIIDVALAGYGTPAAGPVGDAHPFHVPLARPSPSEAESLLDAAGWRPGADGRRARDGRPLSFTLLTIASGDNAIEQLIQADLRARGITMEIRFAELGTFLATARENPKRFDALFAGIPGDLALSHLAAMFDSRLAGGTLDYGGYHTRQLDSLFVAVDRASSEESLAAAWEEVQRELERSAPAAWIYHARGVQGLSARLAGVEMDLRGELPTLTQWRIGSAGTAPREGS
jgi:peptide/nickel transport system substrate-binding protein